MKWTMTKIKRLSREQLIREIDKINGTYTAYTGASKQELVNQFCHLLITQR